MLALSKLLSTKVQSLLSLSDNIAKGLARLEITTLRDLLFYRPTSYQLKTLSPDLSTLQEGELIQTEIVINEVMLPPTKRSPLKVLASNDTGFILLVFFNKVPPFIFNKLRVGSKHTVSGKVHFYEHYFQISHPEFVYGHSLKTALEPIYPLTYGIASRQLHSCILRGLDLLEKEFQNDRPVILNEKKDTNSHPERGKESYHEILHCIQYDRYDYIKSLLEDLKILHLYQVNINQEQIEQRKEECLKKLAEKELIANQLFLKNIRKQTLLKHGNSFSQAIDLQKIILNKLGFALTPDQQKVITEIEADQKLPNEMMRLLQGDVGSGKTLVALLTMVNVVAAKFQTALMVPTDLLANQHYQFFTNALEDTNINIALLTSKISGKQRQNIMLGLENGEIKILIGTHALFQEKVNFKNLGYIVIDEQHRFGVQQRLNLINKAQNPDVLVMTATPIPRSLTLTMFGDMAVSKLTSKPKNRPPITTSIIPITNLQKVIRGLEKKLKEGEKIYWVCPLIDQNEQEQVTNENDMQLTDVMTRFLALESVYPNIVGILHGKMKAEEKDAVMQRFKNGEIKILLATTVIEVGIDVPDATLVIIENAEQFGLSQLHQIRGRVGRGVLPSYCILLYHPQRLTNISRTRLELIKNNNDGFYLAEQDLILRGSGEILGTKQSGDIRFFFADISRDARILIAANQWVESCSSNDSEFTDFQIKLFARTYFSELN